MNMIMGAIQCLILAVVFCTSPAYSQPEVQKVSQTKINDELYFNKIADDVLMITHYFPYWGGNSLVVLLKNKHAILIDTPYDGIASSALLEWLENTYGKLTITAIVTGFHQDNLGGNEVLIEHDIPVYGMNRTADLVRNQAEDLKKVMLKSVQNMDQKAYYERYEKLNFTPPDHLFDLSTGASYIINIEGENIEFFYPGESHTIDNAVVYIHGKSVLFGGCMIRAMQDQRTGFIEYANMEAWPKSVEKVKRKFPSSEIVIPGHGFEGDFELIQHTIDLLNAWNAPNLK
jgi:metallo-beta-lactamase class B